MAASYAQAGLLSSAAETVAETVVVDEVVPAQPTIVQPAMVQPTMQIVQPVPTMQVAEVDIIEPVPTPSLLSRVGSGLRSFLTFGLL